MSGGMASEWEISTVGEFCPFIYGKALPERSRVAGGIPVISSAGVSGSHNAPLVNGGGVVIGRKGTVGSVTLCKSAFWAIDTAFYVPDAPHRNLVFTYYLLKTLGLERMNSDSAVPGLNRDNAHARSISVPPLKEQRAIAHILGTLDDKIELNRKQNETLEAMARALFKAWFVDFKPVRAKMEGRWQRGQSLPGLPAHLYDLFPDRLVDSELGEIPEGWHWVPASEVVEFNPTEPLRKGTVAPYLDMAALPTSGSWPDLPALREFGSGMRFRNGDTLLARITPCLENGKTAFVQCLPQGALAWGSTEFIVLRPKTPVPAEYAYLLARDSAFREHAIRSMTGTSGRQRVQADSVAEFKVASPLDAKIWKAFADFVAPHFKGIKVNSSASQSLAQLRDTLLPKLISGELRVPDAKAFLKECVS